MAAEDKLSLLQKFIRWGNNLIMTSLIPLDHPSRIFKYLFKIPILFYRAGLPGLVPGWMLVLTTRGRKTGRTHQTAMEFIYRPDQDTYWVMSGWAGNTDWFKNARRNPSVGVQIHGGRFSALARSLLEEDPTLYLREIVAVNPGALQIFSRWANRAITADEGSLRATVPFFPCLGLHPIKKSPGD